ncbi:MAG: FHA domain-containing protein [Chloroflexi bacterium]|nr:FHA domain-containing protein [Chloroflexota bacterium]
MMEQQAIEHGISDIPILMVLDGPLRGQQWVMRNDEVIIGRGAHCDIVIPERRISREHVRIWRENNHYYVADLESKNGTHVNAEPLSGARQISEGDEIQIALAVRLKFVGTEATAPLEDIEIRDGEVGLRLDEHTRQVIVDGHLLDPQLSLYQYRLLALLYERAGGVCTREDVTSAVWPEDEKVGVSEQAIDALVRRLRDRLAEVSPEHQYIVTVRGHGFRLEQPLEN